MGKIKALTDLGNTERFLELHATNVRYCAAKKKWYFWEGDHWIADDSKIHVLKKARETVRRIPKEVNCINSGKYDLTKEDILEHAKKSESKSKIKAIVDLAETFLELQISPEQFDSNPILLNCLNGTLNLETGRLRLHRREDLITKTTGIIFNKKAICPIWQQFLKTVVPDDESRRYLQKFFGYVLTGLTVEHIFLILYGYGLNGKSTVLETFRRILGDYARHASAESFLFNNYSRIRSDIARLNGARFVTSVEISEGKKLDEAAVKSLTGGDPVTARNLYQNEIEFLPQFKLAISTNYKPEIKGFDKGIWRRIVLFPFEVEIESDKVDKKLMEKLTREFSGILNWAFQGFLDWDKNGLKIPEKVREATKNYKDESDIIAQFFGDKCEEVKKSKIAVKELYDAFESWADNNCVEKLTKKNFGSIMRRKGYTQGKSGSIRYWTGISLKEDASFENDFEINAEEVAEKNLECVNQ